MLHLFQRKGEVKNGVSGLRCYHCGSDFQSDHGSCNPDWTVHLSEPEEETVRKTVYHRMVGVSGWSHAAGTWISPACI